MLIQLIEHLDCRLSLFKVLGYIAWQTDRRPLEQIKAEDVNFMTIVMICLTNITHLSWI